MKEKLVYAAPAERKAIKAKLAKAQAKLAAAKAKV